MSHFVSLYLVSLSLFFRAYSLYLSQPIFCFSLFLYTQHHSVFFIAFLRHVLLILPLVYPLYQLDKQFLGLFFVSFFPLSLIHFPYTLLHSLSLYLLSLSLASVSFLVVVGFTQFLSFFFFHSASFLL